MAGSCPDAFVSDPEYKVCSCCKQRKQASEFFVRKKRSKNGFVLLSSRCKVCARASLKKLWLDTAWKRVKVWRRRRKNGHIWDSRENRLSNKYHLIDGIVHKHCSTCNKLLPLDSFVRSVRSKDGTYSECKECHSERVRDYWSKDKTEKLHRMSVREKRRRGCAKLLCPDIGFSRIVQITCQVCGTVFGVTRTDFNKSLRDRGYPPKYCSVQCRNTSRTKSWQQNHSPYAKRVKELQKVYK